MSYGMEEWDWIQGAAFIPDVTYLPIENHRWSSADVLVVLVSVAPRAGVPSNQFPGLGRSSCSSRDVISD